MSSFRSRSACACTVGFLQVLAFAALTSTAAAQTPEAIARTLIQAPLRPLITLTLPTGELATGVMDRSERPAPGRFIWIGHLQQVPDSYLAFAINGDVVRGRLVIPDAPARIYELSLDLGVYTFTDVSARRFPPDDGGEALVPVQPPSGMANEVAQPQDDGSTIDLLVAYTATARAAAGGTSSILAAIDLAVAETNAAYANSGVVQRVRLVNTVEMSYPESGIADTDLERLTKIGEGYLDDVHPLRDASRADIVSLIVNDARNAQGKDVCGKGYPMATVSTAFASSAFNVVKRSCLDHYTLAHEMGHNMGLAHDRANAAGQFAFPYAYGYRDPGHFSTIMAYEDGCGAPCPRIGYFSTPTRSVGGRAVGIANSEDNARALNNTASTVANFRSSAAPCTFSVVDPQVAFGWGGGLGQIILLASRDTCAWSVSTQASFLTPGWLQSNATGMADVAVTPDGLVVLAGSDGTIWSSRDLFQFAKSSASGFRRVAAAPDGHVWAVGFDGSVWITLNLIAWTRTAASGMVDVATDGLSRAWLVGNDGNVFYSSDGGITFSQAAAYGMARVGAAGRWDVYLVGRDGTLWVLESGGARFLPTPASGIADAAVDNLGAVWVVGKDGSVWRSPDRGAHFTPIFKSGFVSVGASAKADSLILVADDGTVWTTARASGTGTMLIPYRVAANPIRSRRVGTMEVGGITVTVTQGGTPRQPRPSMDYDGAGYDELGVFRPAEGRFFLSGLPAQDWGLPGDVPVPADYDGDGVTDLAVFRPATGTWHVRGGATIAWGIPGDIPAVADYSGDGIVDIAVFRPSSGTFFIKDRDPVQWGRAGDIPLGADFDGDGAADIAVYRPADGTWYIRGTDVVPFGLPGDIPVPADYDGDGRADIAVFRPSNGTWYVRNIGTFQWGLTGDVPLTLDRNGDGIAELGVFRPSTGMWHFFDRTNGQSQSYAYGLKGDIPLGAALPFYVLNPAPDFDGDRKADVTVFRPATGEWFSLKSSASRSAYSVFRWGLPSDLPVACDYDGDGRRDPAVFRPSSGAWYALLSSTDFAASTLSFWGLPGDMPVPADYDGDGRCDRAVFRPADGRWYISPGALGAQPLAIPWGLPGDVPVPADFDGDRRTDVAVFRPATGQWFILASSSGGQIVRDWGLSGDVPLATDFDGDGKADAAVFRPGTGQWGILSSIDGTSRTIAWGLNGDLPVPGDYDADGKLDIAVYRPSNGTWFVRGMFTQQWGLSGDIPIAR